MDSEAAPYVDLIIVQTNVAVTYIIYIYMQIFIFILNTCKFLAL